MTAQPHRDVLMTSFRIASPVGVGLGLSQDQDLFGVEVARRAKWETH